MERKGRRGWDGEDEKGRAGGKGWSEGIGDRG